MLWILMALLVLIGAAAAMRRRRSYEAGGEDEPWRASLGDSSDELDLDAIREAEEEWLEEEPWDESEGEEWR
jgi:hypothetical protein